MAVKAIAFIEGFDYDNNGVKIVTRCINAANSAEGGQVEQHFGAGSLPATVNASIMTAAQSYVSTNFGVTFTPVVDTVQLLNPVGG